ncbi:hypothetical protein ABBQ38_002679 [Trebouxia sp. C0009 RCD-2024]
MQKTGSGRPYFNCKRWPVVPYDIGPVAYGAKELRVEDLQQPSWGPPWQHSGVFVSAISQELDRLPHLKKRCNEELHTLSREAADMVKFHAKQTADLRCALSVRRSAQSEHMPACPLHIIAVLSHDHQQLLVNEQQFKIGQNVCTG